MFVQKPSKKNQKLLSKHPSIKKEPKSAVKISEETKIPISTVYRRFQMLCDMKLLRISGTINENGKKVFLYKSKIKFISTFFDGSFIEIEIIPNNIEKSQDR